MARPSCGRTVRAWKVLLVSAVVMHLLWRFDSTEASYPDEDVCPREMTHCAPTCEDVYEARAAPASFHRQNCRCDANCVMYGDCCVDYFELCANGTDPWPDRYDFSPHLVCVAPDDPGSESRYLAVGRCPPDWPADDVRQNCENETLARSQRFLSLPVHGPYDVLFKNVYCAMCHRVSDPVPWRVRLRDCELAGGEPDLDDCTGWQALPPKSVPGQPHRCFRNAVDSCPDITNATDSQIALCGNHTSRLFDLKLGDTYKNVYCTYCYDLSRERFLSRGFSCRPVRASGNPTLSLVVLFDFNTGWVQIEKTNSFVHTTTIIRTIGECGLGQQYDPFMGVCRNLTCTRGRELQMGQCVEHSNQTITNKQPGCLKQLLSDPNLVNISSYDAEDPLYMYGLVSVYVDMSVAAHTQRVVDQLFSRYSTARCIGSTQISLLLVASQADASRSGVCEGFTLHDVAVDEIASGSDSFYVNISGHTYAAGDFVHVTKYKMTNGTWSRNEYLTLCDPFVEDGCDVSLVFNVSEFVVSSTGDDAVFVHVASGSSFDVGDVWQLPDGTLRLCNFLSGPFTYPSWLTTLSDFSFAGSVCSIVVLSITLFTYSRFSVLRNVPGQIVMNLAVALILAQAVLVVGKPSLSWLCVARGLVLHFAWLAVFAWMSTLAGNLACAMRSTRPPSRLRDLGRHKAIKFCVVAWGFPAAFVGACFVVSRLSDEQSSFNLQYGGSQCWIEDPIHALFVFGLPLSVLLLVNALFLVVMIYTVTANRRRLATAKMGRDRHMDILLCLKLLIVTGATWFLFVFANVIDVVVVWYLAVFVNSVQGALVGLIFLLKSNVRALWQQQLAALCSCRRGVGSRRRRIRQMGDAQRDCTGSLEQGQVNLSKFDTQF